MQLKLPNAAFGLSHVRTLCVSEDLLKGTQIVFLGRVRSGPKLVMKCRVNDTTAQE
jgi:hypothetical protein